METGLFLMEEILLLFLLEIYSLFSLYLESMFAKERKEALT